MTIPTITSELDAINIMLSCIGEAPVASVDTSISEVEMANMTLNQTILEVLSRGRNFNREVEITLYPNDNGEIVLPAGTLWIDVSKFEDNELVQRGGKLYDRANHTYILNRSVKADINLILDFEDLPFAARLFIAIRAARKFQADVQGSETIYRFSQKSEDDAERSFEALDAQAEDANVLNSNYHAFNILRRYGPYRY